MELALAPIQYFWPKEEVLRFYQQVAKSPIQRVYLGETVCFKRRELTLEDWLAIAEQLHDAGKEVVLSTLTLCTANSELKQMQKLIASDFQIEANDMAAIQSCIEHQKPFICGPSLNIYSSESLATLKRLGASEWVAPYEANGEQIAQVIDTMQMPTEVFAYGYIPLAWSARCYTARHLDLSKDQCELACIRFPEGILVHSKEGEPLFTLNGIQTQSGRQQNYLPILNSLKSAGVQRLRLSLSNADELKVVYQYQQAIDEGTNILALDSQCNGYWHSRAGMDLHP